MKTAVTILAAVVLTLGVQNVFFSGKNTGPTSSQPAYDRVIKTNTLRCAYALYPPLMSKDPNTGKLSGFMFDVMAAFEKSSAIKVEWGPEIDFGNIIPTIQSGKAEAFCSGMALTPVRGHALAGSIPLTFGALEAYARQDDKRFDNAPDKINTPDVKIEVNMGDMSEQMAKRFFPKATLVYRGTMGGEDQLFLDVAMKKADLTFSGPSNMSTYNRSNPANALRQIPFSRPLSTFYSVVAVEIHEAALLNLLNASLQDLVDNGEIDTLLKKATGKDYGTAYLPPKPRI